MMSSTVWARPVLSFYHATLGQQRGIVLSGRLAL
jgi:hypothetical protein